MMVVRSSAAVAVPQPETISSDWRERLPLLAGEAITAAGLQLSMRRPCSRCSRPKRYQRLHPPPPTTVEECERFIEWTHKKRAAGEPVCFGIVPHGMTAAVGIIRFVRSRRASEPARWGFALGSPFWGNGMFIEGAQMVLDFAFEDIGVHRMEARCAVHNGRGNGGAAQARGGARGAPPQSRS